MSVSAFKATEGPGWLNELGSWITYHQYGGFVPSFINYKKGCTRLAAASDKVYQLLAHGRWFSPGTTASSTTKTGRHDLVEILLKVALNTKINKIKTAVNFIYITSELSALIICRISFIYNRQVLNYMEIEL